jgi:hypothetical protein
MRKQPSIALLIFSSFWAVANASPTFQNSAQSLPVAHQPQPPFYDALTSALDFFTKLKNQVTTSFRDPALRQDAIKQLETISDTMNEVISKNSELELATRSGDRRVMRSDAHDLETIVREKLIPQLDSVTSLVPASDREAAAKAVNELERLVQTHEDAYDAMYRFGSLEASPNKGSQQLTDAAQMTLDISYRIREKVNSLITELNKENSK